jgi:outer membrane protein assembly factor BamA
MRAIPGLAQMDPWVIVSIEILGNSKTAPEIIRQELDIQVGDRFKDKDLSAALIRNKQFILNTQLFNDVSIELEEIDQQIALLIKVEERGLYGIGPLFELADRNLNVWWKEFNFDPNRVSLGIKNRFLNLGGLADYLTLTLQVGYTRKFEIAYFRPYFNSNSRWGSSGKFLHTRSKQIGYTTQNNLLIFNQGLENFITDRLEIEYTLYHRTGKYTFQQFKASFKQFQVEDFLLSQLTDDLFNRGRSSQSSFNLDYHVRWDKRNFWLYPTRGYLFEFKTQKMGLGIMDEVNHWWIKSKAEGHWDFNSKRFSIGSVWHASHELLGEEMAYFNSRALGYEDNIIRGYETYVMDGRSFIHANNQLKWNAYNFAVHPRKYINSAWVPGKIPFQCFLSIHTDFGYVYNPKALDNNTLQNQWLYSMGLGVDVVFRYTNLGSIHFSRTREGEMGLFIGIKGLL